MLALVGVPQLSCQEAALGATAPGAAAPLPESSPYTDSILVGLGWGATLPLTPGFAPGTGVETISTGPLLDDLVRGISIHRTVSDRLGIDIDHDSQRLAEGELFGGANIYSLRWQGWEGEALQSVSLGNLDRAIPGSRYVPLDGGGPESFAVRAVVQAGPVLLEGLARYGGELEGIAHFRGSRLAVQVDLPEIDYLRGQYFLLPDAGIDETGLRVAKSSSTGAIVIDGRRYALLSRGVDYRLDNAAGRLTLSRALLQSEELAISYRKGGVTVGDAGLGVQAIIDESGSRADFLRSDPRFSTYFGLEGATTWLFLRRQGLGSYWEIRGVFPLEELEDGQLPESLSVEVLQTSTLAPNPAYDAIASQFKVSTIDGTLSFEPSDAVGYYPRPFPGAEPFPGNNPFDPSNPIYGGPSYAPADASVTTLRVRYLLSCDTLRLAPGLIADSVRVKVDGRLIDPASYTVDATDGTISFLPGAIGPESDVEVTYRWSPLAGAGREVVTALGAGIGDERLGARNLFSLRLPIADAPAPLLGQERFARLADSIDAQAAFGADREDPEATGFTAAVRASAAIGVSLADRAGLAIVADMEDDRRLSVSTSEEAWVLASRSAGIAGMDRGDLRYENLWEHQVLGGDALRDVSWDNAANLQFTYAEKAGPYNSSDQPSGATATSLVFDVAFPADSIDPWAAASTVLGGLDAGSVNRLDVWLRGVGVDGPPGVTLQVYVEALSLVNEDIDADGQLDGEDSAAQPGYGITPSGGRSTIIGSDRRGQSNGKLDSEDRNSNGSLDVGPETPDTAVVIEASPGAGWVAEIAAGTTDWKDVTIDIADLVKNHPTVFRDLRGIRITVKPSSVAAAAVTGKLLVGGLWFSGSAMGTTSSALSARGVTSSEDAALASRPFAAAYPALYGSLHGSLAWRTDHGLADRALSCDVVSPVAPGDAVAVRLGVTPPQDISRFRLLRMYLLFLPGQAPPPDSAVTVALASGSDTLSVEVPGTGFQEGWNEVALRLETPWSVTVNGAAAGSLLGATGAIRRVGSVSLGLKAGASGIAQGFRFITDEWHLAEERAAVETAGYAEAEAGWLGAALSAGSFPLLSDPLLSAGVEHRDGTFLGPFDSREGGWHAGAQAGLLGVLNATVEAGGALQSPSSVDPGIAPSLLEGSSNRWAAGLVLDTGVPWLPVVEHRWEGSTALSRLPTVSTSGLEVASYDHDLAVMTLSERMGDDDEGPFQSATFTRTWSHDSRDLIEAADGTLLETSGADGLVDAAKALAGWRWDQGQASALASRDMVFAAPSGAAAIDGPLAWASRIGTLFADPTVSLPGAQEKSLRDRLWLSVEIPRAKYLGASLCWESAYTELNVDPLTGKRDATDRDAISLGLSASPDGTGRLVLSPALSLCFTGSYSGVSPSLDEGTLLFAPWPALLAAFAGRAREHAAADAFAGSSALATASNLVTTSFSLAARLASGPWFLPDRASVSLRGETGRYGNARSQKRILGLSLGKNAEIEAGTLGVDALASFTTNYGTRSRGLSISGDSSLQRTDARGAVLEISANGCWTRDRQYLADPSLTLFPGVPDDPGLVIAPIPDRDTLRAAISVGWTSRVQATTNSERLSMESIMTWAAAGVASSVPVRATFVHSSELAVSDTFCLGLSGKLAAGLERRTGSGDPVLIPAVGFEVGITGRLQF